MEADKKQTGKHDIQKESESQSSMTCEPKLKAKYEKW